METENSITQEFRRLKAKIDQVHDFQLNSNLTEEITKSCLADVERIMANEDINASIRRKTNNTIMENFQRMVRFHHPDLYPVPEFTLAIDKEYILAYFKDNSYSSEEAKYIGKELSLINKNKREQLKRLYGELLKENLQKIKDTPNMSFKSDDKLFFSFQRSGRPYFQFTPNPAGNPFFELIIKIDRRG